MKIDQGWRYTILFGFFSLAGILILGQTIRFQVLPEAQEVRRQGDDLYQGAWVEIAPPRGQIYDRWGHLMAGNKIVYEIGIELQFVEDAETIAQVLNAVLGMDFQEVVQKASLPYIPDESVYAVTARGVSAEQAAVIQAFIDRWEESNQEWAEENRSLAGLVMFPYLHRTYPEKDLASSLIGFVSLDGHGYYGIEQNYDNMLTGLSRKVWIPYNPNNVTELPDIPPGVSLVLTTDREIQVMVEEILDKAIEQYDAKSATAIVMNPETGEVYAMASTPRLNLNEYWNFQEVYPGTTPFNRSVSQTYEPGSVFKVFTMAAALDSETVEPETTFLDTGNFEIGGITIRNWNNEAWGEQDMTGCLQHSLNVCLAWVGTELGADQFYAYMDDFGFGHFTGVDLAGEAIGRLKAPGDGDWYPADLGANTFGQGISVTPLQLVTAASALANDGQMVVPHLVHSIVDGESQYNIRTQVAGRPISPETAKNLNEMLANSLEAEESLALVSGYRLAGKTGTAQVPGDNGYIDEVTNASFIGWGPVDDPKFVVFVWLEEPTPIWGSLTASPVFGQIVERLVVLLNIPPDAVRQELAVQ